MANPAINAALIAAAAKHADHSADLAKQLRAKGATTARAATILDLSVSGTEQVLKSLVKQGYIREAGGERYWLDEDRYARAKAAGTRFALILLAFLLSAGASLLAYVSVN